VLDEAPIVEILDSRASGTEPFANLLIKIFAFAKNYPSPLLAVTGDPMPLILKLFA
jgi:hypothetical protein